MHRSMKMFLRAFAVFVIVSVTAYNTERWICNSDNPPEGDHWTVRYSYDPPKFVWRFYEGAYLSWWAFDEATRFPCRSIYYECTGFRNHMEEASPLDHALFAAIALASAILWSRSIPSGPLRLPLGAQPLSPEATTRNNRRLRGMVVRSGSCLAVTLLGAFHGLAFAFGLLGWWYGSRLCGQYEMLGRRPHWMAVAASKIGAAMLFASILIPIGILLLH